ncbi:hypothetical protein CANMA_001343 [Candida margitis]|uniref:uncharacterized protein n=1 Tax=Candida margitis TaxID=1775924 RepID=UPI0022277CB2|nr:uncharacterized protein CANMA_001343 [Candida margitis]KAI5969680.1 hypothetical protein CANMA_001343 [Candida margitis]
MDHVWQAIELEGKVPFCSFAQNLLTGKLLSIFNLNLQDIDRKQRTSPPNPEVYNDLGEENCVIETDYVNHSGLSFKYIKLKEFYTNKDCQWLQVPVFDFKIDLKSKFVSSVFTNYFVPLLGLSG